MSPQDQISFNRSETSRAQSPRRTGGDVAEPGTPAIWWWPPAVAPWWSGFFHQRQAAGRGPGRSDRRSRIAPPARRMLV